MILHFDGIALGFCFSCFFQDAGGSHENTSSTSTENQTTGKMTEHQVAKLMKRTWEQRCSTYKAKASASSPSPKPQPSQPPRVLLVNHWSLQPLKILAFLCHLSPSSRQTQPLHQSLTVTVPRWLPLKTLPRIPSRDNSRFPFLRECVRLSRIGGFGQSLEIIMFHFEIRHRMSVHFVSVFYLLQTTFNATLVCSPFLY